MNNSESGLEKGEGQEGASPSQLIDASIAELGDWRGETLARVRMFIKEADAQVVESWKWRGAPGWEHAGIICTGETYNDKVKPTFAKGAALNDLGPLQLKPRLRHRAPDRGAARPAELPRPNEGRLRAHW